jgi:DNA-directed RNA polymerase specialized sigma24 family protein
MIFGKTRTMVSNFADIAKLIHSNMEATKKRFYRLLEHLRKQMELDYE